MATSQGCLGAFAQIVHAHVDYSIIVRVCKSHPLSTDLGCCTFTHGYTCRHLTVIHTDVPASLLILLADTWLHLGTEAVTISRSFTMPGVSEESDDRRLEAFVPEGLDRQRVLEIKDAMYDKGSFSGPGWPGSWSIRVPNATCGGATDVDRLGLPCGLDVSGRQHNRLAQYTDVVHFLANSTSSLAAGVGYRPQITQFDDTGTNSTMVMVVPSDIQQGVNFSVDFTASTYGASTNCTPKMGICDMFAGYQYNFTFDCTKNGSTYNHSATIPEQSTVHENLTLYSDPEYINPMRWNANGFYLGNTSLALPTLDMVNPSYPAIAMASVSLPTYDSAAEILEPLAEALGAVLFCKHTIWNVNYTFLNSSWTIDNVVPSTTAVANMSNIPLMLGSLQTYFDYRVDDVLSEQDPMSLANNFANAYSWASMALLEPNLDSAPVNKIQIRRHLLVTRVPKAPLFCLVVLNLLYAALGLALTIDALRVVRKNRDLVDVQAPLTLPGLTAECFEAVDSVGKKVVASEDLFAEKKGGVGAKIGLRRDGESRYVGDGHEGEEKEEKEEIAGYGWRLTRYDIEEVRQRKRNDDDEGDKQDTRKDNAAVADGLLGPSDPPVRIRNV